MTTMREIDKITAKIIQVNEEGVLEEEFDCSEGFILLAAKGAGVEEHGIADIESRCAMIACTLLSLSKAERDAVISYVQDRTAEKLVSEVISKERDEIINYVQDSPAKNESTSKGNVIPFRKRGE